MKQLSRRVLFLALVLMSVLHIDAQKIKFEGNKDYIEENATAKLSIDVSGATWEKSVPFKTHFGEEFEDIMKVSKEAFTIGFNQNSPKLTIDDSSNSPKYLIKIKPTNFFQRKGWGPYGRMILKIWGTIEVIDASSSEIIFSGKLDGFLGHADFKTIDRFSKLYMELGKSFALQKK